MTKYWKATRGLKIINENEEQLTTLISDTLRHNEWENLHSKERAQEKAEGYLVYNQTDLSHNG